MNFKYVICQITKWFHPSTINTDPENQNVSVTSSTKKQSSVALSPLRSDFYCPAGLTIETDQYLCHYKEAVATKISTDDDCVLYLMVQCVDRTKNA